MPTSTKSEEPSVMCVMLTRDRPEMAQQAIECFRAQTYRRKYMMIWDTGDGTMPIPFDAGIYYERQPSALTVGALRNSANAYADPLCLDCDIIIHWDDDDWSHPGRIAQQVGLLQGSGAECVGYREMLFWREASLSGDDLEYFDPGGAWLYTNGNERWALGTSLCYWRKTWERRRFPEDTGRALGRGEDTAWLRGVNCLSVSAFTGDPRMIARIHADNADNPAYSPTEMLDHDRMMHRGEANWKRVPEWDEYCRVIFEETTP